MLSFCWQLLTRREIPVTVLSRCLQFNLKRLLPGQIFTQMQDILGQEQIESEPLALQLLARAADGSMRDGLSLLDQAIVYGAGKVTADDVSAMLGAVAQRPVEDILNALANSDAHAILNKTDEIANIQPDFSAVLQQILQILHRIALVQQIPCAIEHEFDKEIITALSQRFTPEDVQLYYQIALVGQKDLDLAPDSRMGFEMVMLRMLTFKPISVESTSVKSKQPSVPTVPSSIPEPQPALNVEQGSPSERLAEKVTQHYSGNESPVNHTWTDMIEIMKLESLTKELANNCVSGTY